MNLTQSALFPSRARSLPGCAGRVHGRLATLLRQGWQQWLLTLVLALLLTCPGTSAHAAEITVNQASIEASDEGYRLSVSYDFELNRGQQGRGLI
jgi:hypothetical protein